MKKIILSLSTICLLYSNLSATKIAIPLPADSLSIENSGTKQPIDAYQDGVGIYTLESIGGNKTDNSEMNALVFKYGEAAKELNVSVKEYVQTNGNEKEKVLANNVGKFEPIMPGDGTPCNDNNAQTINDIYTNGVCAGTNTADGTLCDDGNINTANDMYHNGICSGTLVVNGTACNDGNPATKDDKYVNGVCVGIDYVSNFYKVFKDGHATSGGSINFSTYSLYGYRTMGSYGPIGYVSDTLNNLKLSGIKQIDMKVNSSACGMGFLGVNYTNVLLENYNYGISYATYNINFTNMTANVSASYGIAAKNINLNNYDLSTLRFGALSTQAQECWQEWKITITY